MLQATNMLTIILTIQLSLLTIKSQTSSNYNINDVRYLPCSSISHVIPMVNNNSISTAISDQNNMYIAVTAKNA